MRDETLTEPLSLTDEGKLLPKGWHLVRLGDVCTLQRGYDLPRQIWVDGTYPIVGSNGVIGFHNEFMAKAPGVVTGRSGTIGKVHYIDSDYFPHNTSLYVKDFKGNNPRFVKYLLESLDLKSLGEQTTAVPSLDRKNAHKLEVALPQTIEEQRRIASILDEQMKAVEQARLAIEEQLAAANLLPNAFLCSVFESDEAQHWQKRKLGQFAKVQSGYAFKTDWYVKDGIRLLRNANVFQGFIDWSDVVKLNNEARPKFAAYELNKGDIVLSLDRPLVSNGLKVARLSPNDVPSLLLQRVGRFILNDEIDSNYLYIFLNSDNFINSIKGHDQSLGVPHISPSQVENIEMPTPPTTEEQRKIAERLNEQMQAVETLKQSLTEKLQAIKNLPAALLRKAFAGEI